MGALRSRHRSSLLQGVCSQVAFPVFPHPFPTRRPVQWLGVTKPTPASPRSSPSNRTLQGRNPSVVAASKCRVTRCKRFWAVEEVLVLVVRRQPRRLMFPRKAGVGAIRLMRGHSERLVVECQVGRPPRGLVGKTQPIYRTWPIMRNGGWTTAKPSVARATTQPTPGTTSQVVRQPPGKIPAIRCPRPRPQALRPRRLLPQQHPMRLPRRVRRLRPPLLPEGRLQRRQALVHLPRRPPETPAMQRRRSTPTSIPTIKPLPTR